jgi:hypothetical protein
MFPEMAFELGSKVQISQDALLCSEQNFSSPGQIPKLITHKQMIISGHANSHWKYEKIIP